MSIAATSRIRYIGITLFVIAIGLYGLFQARDLIEGPVITVDSPINGETLRDSLVTISGTAEHISEIKLNGRRILVNEEGQFNEQLLLAGGYTIMTLTARDRFGREVHKDLELVYRK